MHRHHRSGKGLLINPQLIIVIWRSSHAAQSLILCRLHGEWLETTVSAMGNAVDIGRHSRFAIGERGVYLILSGIRGVRILPLGVTTKPKAIASVHYSRARAVRSHWTGSPTCPSESLRRVG